MAVEVVGQGCLGFDSEVSFPGDACASMGSSRSARREREEERQAGVGW